MGPTQDDITKETVAEVLGRSMLTDETSLMYLKRFFERIGRTMTPNNLKQVEFPIGSIILPNPNGTAPGCIVEDGGKAFIMLPGPPGELYPMFKNHVWPYLEKRSGMKFCSRIMRIFGVGESTIDYTIRDLLESQTNPTIAPYAQPGEAVLRVTACCVPDEDPDEILMPTIEQIRSRFGDAVYSIDDEPLEVVVAKALKTQNKTIALAESCTGGMITSQLVNVPGISSNLIAGLVTYSNESKVNQLGVKNATLERFGAVSDETAREMAEGLYKVTGADVALSVTGIAGPDGGSEEKPKGLVYIAIKHKDGIESFQLKLTGSRQRIRTLATLNALDIIRKYLKKAGT